MADLLRRDASHTQLVLDGFQNAVRVAQHAGGGRANLNEVFSHRLTQEHGVEGGYLVHPHRRDLQHLGNLKERDMLKLTGDFSGEPSRPILPKGANFAVPCSWRRAGATRVASGPHPAQGWLLPAYVQQGTWKRLPRSSTRKAKI